MDTVILVIDMQIGHFTGAAPVSDGARLLQTVAWLVEKARAADVPVVFLQNDGQEGEIDSPVPGGWHIHPAVLPAPDEPVIPICSPDAFHETSLEAELSELGARRLVICGVQTEVCIDTTVRRAFSLGYEVVLVEDGHGTWGSPILTAQQIIAHHNRVLSAFFAQAQPANQINFW